MRALIARDVVVLARLLRISGQRFWIEHLAHVQCLAHQELRGAYFVVVPVEGHAQKRTPECIAIRRIEIQVVGTIRHAGALDLVIKRMPEGIFDALFPCAAPVGDARSGRNAADRARTRLSGPDHTAADEARLRAVQLVAVQVIKGGAAAADPDKSIGLYALVEEQRDAV